MNTIRNLSFLAADCVNAQGRATRRASANLGQIATMAHQELPEGCPLRAAIKGHMNTNISPALTAERILNAIWDYEHGAFPDALSNERLYADAQARL